ncbi:ATP-binding cassette sub-family A member 3 [Planoprotostelium fungivorum]|uniref:ATP-binding cassette sub-family A member 3 n=1 Tax=Planoprotostelium fungivorum TaxID=1890364 RepID=A0A2P6NEH5_9EUKA|nr:ATP-binding cassette sub-family A member 3 [Planoprotostelium fungivorum]
MELDLRPPETQSSVPLEDKTSFVSHVRATTWKNLSVMIIVPLGVLIGIAMVHWFSRGDPPFSSPSQSNGLNHYGPIDLEGNHIRGPNLSDDVILGSISSTVNQTYRKGLLGFTGSYRDLSRPQISSYNGSTHQYDDEMYRRITGYWNRGRWNSSVHITERFAFMYHDVDVMRSRLNVTLQVIEPEQYRYYELFESDIMGELYGILFSSMGSARKMKASCKSGEGTEDILREYNNTQPPFYVHGTSRSWTLYIPKTGDKDFNTLVFTWMIPVALGWSLPVLTYFIVTEKKSRSVEMMKITGMSMTAYWLSMWVFFGLLNILIALLLSIIGLSLKMSFFFQVNITSWSVLFMLHSFSQPMLSMLMSTFFSRPIVATVVMHMLTPIFYVASQVLNLIVWVNDPPPWYLMLFPPYALNRGVWVIGASLFQSAQPLSFSDIFHGELIRIYGCLVASAVFLFLCTIYLENVLPKEYGVREPLHFPYLHFRDMLRKRRGKELNDRTSLLFNTPNNQELIDIRGIQEYPGKKALSGLSLQIRDGECVGLLGPNGAGKSTLAHILCGIIPPSGGDAYIAGKNITYEMFSVRKALGFCPQHEIVWDDLTAREHVLFYMRIKGVSHLYEDEETDRVLSCVGLLDEKDKMAKDMSTGMKRRLSIGISIIGNPKCLILDEPTNGLDPETRRAIWELIQSQKPDKAVIITTHNMEEADTLCTKIAIISQAGKLVCEGIQLELKRKYGRGYKLSISALPSRLIEADTYIRNKYPSARADVVAGGVVNYYVQKEEVDMGTIFGDMKREKKENGITEWSISQTSLEEVFLEALQET